MNISYSNGTTVQSVIVIWDDLHTERARQAVSCRLDLIAEDAIELLTLIDQPAYYYEGSR